MVVCFFRLEGVTYDTPGLLAKKFRSYATAMIYFDVQHEAPSLRPLDFVFHRYFHMLKWRKNRKWTLSLDCLVLSQNISCLRRRSLLLQKLLCYFSSYITGWENYFDSEDPNWLPEDYETLSAFDEIWKVNEGRWPHMLF